MWRRRAWPCAVRPRHLAQDVRLEARGAHEPRHEGGQPRHHRVAQDAPGRPDVGRQDGTGRPARDQGEVGHGRCDELLERALILRRAAARRAGESATVAAQRGAGLVQVVDGLAAGAPVLVEVLALWRPVGEHLCERDGRRPPQLCHRGGQVRRDGVARRDGNEAFAALRAEADGVDALGAHDAVAGVLQHLPAGAPGGAAAVREEVWHVLEHDGPRVERDGEGEAVERQLDALVVRVLPACEAERRARRAHMDGVQVEAGRGQRSRDAVRQWAPLVHVAFDGDGVRVVGREALQRVFAVVDAGEDGVARGLPAQRQAAAAAVRVHHGRAGGTGPQGRRVDVGAHLPHLHCGQVFGLTPQRGLDRPQNGRFRWRRRRCMCRRLSAWAAAAAPITACSLWGDMVVPIQCGGRSGSIGRGSGVGCLGRGGRCLGRCLPPVDAPLRLGALARRRPRSVQCGVGGVAVGPGLAVAVGREVAVFHCHAPAHAHAAQRAARRIRPAYACGACRRLRPAAGARRQRASGRRPACACWRRGSPLRGKGAYVAAGGVGGVGRWPATVRLQIAAPCICTHGVTATVTRCGDAGVLRRRWRCWTPRGRPCSCGSCLVAAPERQRGGRARQPIRFRALGPLQ